MKHHLLACLGALFCLAAFPNAADARDDVRRDLSKKHKHHHEHHRDWDRHHHHHHHHYHHYHHWHRGVYYRPYYYAPRPYYYY